MQTDEGLVLRRFNLLVGCPREREHAAKSEVQYFIGDLLDDPDLLIMAISGSGLLTCWTTLDPFQTTHELRKFAIENPYQFRFALRFTPIERCVPSSLDEIVSAVVDLRDKIQDNESFRVTVRRRQSKLTSMDVVHKVAEVIHRRVDLKRPDKTVWVEIIGEISGISVLVRDDDILSVRTIENGVP
ncbi:MAG: hypothetical protein C4K47_07560 [Candidatus Thorarchaeota archaeon]|nr:MAG: hypothetical protein C4K47_07560 [Candidatus Thorarchaeota archaeon]